MQTGERFERFDLTKDPPFARGHKSDKSFTAHWPLQTPTCYGGAGLVERLAGQLASDFEPQSSLASFRARFLYSPDDVLVTRVRRTG